MTDTTETIHKFPNTTKAQVANVKSCSRQEAGFDVGDLHRFFGYANFGVPTMVGD